MRVPRPCRLATLAVVALLLLLTSRPAQGQVIPQCAGCVGVRVTPDGASLTVLPNTTGNTASFSVLNTGQVTSTYTFTCTAKGNVTCQSVTPSQRTLAAGSDDDVVVTFSASGPGSGTITLSASGGGTDTGSYTVSIQNAGAPVVALRNDNADNLDRSLCLTTGAGESAASVCGDLVVTHALPGYETMGRERALTLIYNSRTAYYRPVITVAVTEPAGIATPNAVYVELEVLGVVRTTRTYSPAGWGNTTRQIGMSYDAPGYGHATGVYPFTLRVQNQYASGAMTTAVSGNLIVVNRYTSRYGAGVGIAGVEELVFNQPVGQSNGSILWVGGDGSAKLYAPAGTNRWLAPAGAFRDTLVYNPTAQTYTRTLRHNVQVVFNSAGRHTATIARTTQQTSFTWNLDTLKSITVPPGGASGVTYSLAYDNATGYLDRITDPVNRVLDVAITGGVLTSVVDPDGHGTAFGYDGDRKMTSRTNRRGITTRYEYANTHRLTKVTIPVGRQALDTATAVTQFAPWDERGLLGQATVDTALAYTRILGPRFPHGVPDTAAIWIDRWGAPTRIVDATPGTPGTTVIVRGNATVPALVTRVQFPDNRIDSMTYDARGNLTALIDSTKHTAFPLPMATTTYVYGDADAPDSPSKITDPEGVITKYGYNTLGLTQTVTAPNGHITKFVYRTAGSLIGFLKAATEQKVPAWDPVLRQVTVDSQHTGFEPNSLGNVVSDTSPMGRVRRYPRDSKQRVASFYDPVNHRTDYVYDDLNRVLQSSQRVELDGLLPGFPKDPGFAAALPTTWHYDIDVLDQVTDPRGVVRQFGYDLAGRKIAETDDFGLTDSLWLDRSGMIDSSRARNGLVVRHVYDAAGRTVKTAWMAGTGGTMADSALYQYDIMARLTQAAITGGSVSRTYYGTGALRTEVLNSSTPALVVSQQYYYDRAGRRTAYRTGTGGDPLHRDSVTYTYDAKGQLAQLAVKWRTLGNLVLHDDWVRFSWDSLGRRDSLTYSNGMNVRFAYDQDGLLRLQCTTAGVSNPAINEIARFRIVHDTVDLDGMIRRTNVATLPVPLNCTTVNNQAAYNPVATYDNRHQLKTRTEGPHSASYVYDGSGNLIHSRVDADSSDDVVDSLHNRLVRRHELQANTWDLYSYNDAGSRIIENPCASTSCPGANIGFRGYFYDGLERMAGTSDAVCSGGLCQPTPETSCAYDALGRLLTPCENLVPNLGYDGPNVVRTGSDNSGISDWTFIHGPGVDDPLLGHFAGTKKYAYFVTDGQGRQLAVVDSTGVDLTLTPEYASQGGKYAGGTANGSSFGASRQPSAQIPGVSFFRNRVYDQKTQRWTQEDPVGVAGGLNLYRFNGNNPATYIDPFGLRPDTLQLQVVRTAPGKYHTSIRVAPNDGSKAFTLGAGPSSIFKAVFGKAKLVSNPNRAGDTGPQTARYTLDPGTQGEAAAIKRLEAQDAAYKDNLNYDFFPEAGGAGYNSNSYTAGMLKAAGIALPAVPYDTPGLEKPIPAQDLR